MPSASAQVAYAFLMSQLSSLLEHFEVTKSNDSILSIHVNRASTPR